eukprot:Nitzschia sp. Nitz4//scaffold19_size178191//125707//127000//NITZ4_001996-RA/size178191-processed-gene-0.80-mRNA-1//-1//CDS//3329540738//8385//frame0
MRVADIRTELESRGIDTAGNRTDLMMRLLDALEDAKADATPESTSSTDPTMTTKKTSTAPPATADESSSLSRPPAAALDSTAPSPKLQPPKDPSVLDNIPLDPKLQYTLRVKGSTITNLPGVGIGLVLYDPVFNEPVRAVQIFMDDERTGLEAETAALVMGGQYARTVLNLPNVQIESSSKASMKQARATLQGFSLESATSGDMDYVLSLAMEALESKQSSASLLSNGKFMLQDTTKPVNTLATPTNIDPSLDYLLQFDGGSRGNPGAGGAGMALFQGNTEVWHGFKYHSTPVTNNLAEYSGLLYGLMIAKAFGIQKLTVEGDSQLIVRQMLGVYRCKDNSLKKYFYACKDLAREFESFDIRHVRREFNKRADELANHAMDLQATGGLEALDNSARVSPD